MHAITVTEAGGPEQIQWSEVPTPTPASGEVLVRTVAAGVNRADVLQRMGHYPPPKGISDVLGLEASGVVVELGEGVTGLAEGDEVVCLLAGGGQAEYFVAPQGQCIAVPQGIDAVTAAGTIEVAATVVSNMDHVGLQPGEVFLVHGGAGGIGSFAIQYAKALGCTVIATAGSERKLEHCRAMGADVAIDYHEDWVAAVKEATRENRGVDVILDVMGAKYLEMNLDVLATDGRQVTIGLQGGRKGTLDMAKLLNKRATVTATSLRFRPLEQKAEICQRVAEVVWPMIADGRIKPSPETRMPIQETRRAHEQLEGGDNMGKIILTL